MNEDPNIRDLLQLFIAYTICIKNRLYDVRHTFLGRSSIRGIKKNTITAMYQTTGHS